MHRCRRDRASFLLRLVLQSEWKLRLRKGNKIDDLKLQSTDGDVVNINDFIGKKH